jgi:homoserine kinase
MHHSYSAGSPSDNAAMTTASSIERGVARAFGPASLSNLGPGFDTLGLCIDHAGDVVEASRCDDPGVRIVSIENDDGLLPTEAHRNTAAIAAKHVLDAASADFGLTLRITKGIPFGSGIGGSAASAVAGAWAANALLDEPLPKSDLVEAVITGEAAASGSRHGDNVLPALFGGLILTSSSDPTRYRRIELPRELSIAVLTPSIRILTREAREILPAQVALRDAVHNTSELAFLIDAFHAGDWETVGRCIMGDRLVEPVRATLIPIYDDVRRSALEAGAFGCAITGSGPAMFAICPGPVEAQSVLDAMLDACRRSGVESSGFVAHADGCGVRLLDE